MHESTTQILTLGLISGPGDEASEVTPPQASSIMKSGGGMDGASQDAIRRCEVATRISPMPTQADSPRGFLIPDILVFI